MPYILVRNRVTDYDAWKRVFDEHGAMREAHGSGGGYLFRSSHDPNEVVILLEWDGLEEAEHFAQSDDLRQAMQRAGVVDRPDVYFLELVGRVPV